MYPSLAANTVPARALTERVADGRLGMKTGEGFFRWTAESIAAERQRYDRLLAEGLRLIAAELPRIDDTDDTDNAADSDGTALRGA